MDTPMVALAAIEPKGLGCIAGDRQQKIDMGAFQISLYWSVTLIVVRYCFQLSFLLSHSFALVIRLPRPFLIFSYPLYLAMLSLQSSSLLSHSIPLNTLPVQLVHCFDRPFNYFWGRGKSNAIKQIEEIIGDRPDGRTIRVSLL
jgi:hypothetical protein